MWAERVAWVNIRHCAVHTSKVSVFDFVYGPSRPFMRCMFSRKCLLIVRYNIYVINKKWQSKVGWNAYTIYRAGADIVIAIVVAIVIANAKAIVLYCRHHHHRCRCRQALYMWICTFGSVVCLAYDVWECVFEYLLNFLAENI